MSGRPDSWPGQQTTFYNDHLWPHLCISKTTSPQALPPREVTGNQFRDGANVYNGDAHYHKPPPAARAIVHTIPYPQNEEIIERKDIVDQLDKLLPSDNTKKIYQSATLWGLGGSGKTQIALDYAYRQFQDQSCSVFWVHADSEATFMQDYKTIAKTLGLGDLVMTIAKGIHRMRIEDCFEVLTVSNANGRVAAKKRASG
ncbi:hypothetical protein PT974_12563 [Cladobotryum mycophilum]|uniref:NB-ARC domain-containing protein n=1 Tax=Cladobotryum mycophilum TaxID=491253 RepID=A0ABR0S8C2_9HYPO